MQTITILSYNAIYEMDADTLSATISLGASASRAFYQEEWIPSVRASMRAAIENGKRAYERRMMQLYCQPGMVARPLPKWPY